MPSIPNDAPDAGTPRPKTSPPGEQTVLYAEDDENYSLLMECAFKKGGFQHRLRHVKDGVEAIAYLRGEGKYADRSQSPFPRLVLLDLKMPRAGGFEVLEWIRRCSDHPHLPVVVLTCSDGVKDIRRAYELGANSFLVKPINVADLQDTLKAVDQYWMKWNVLEQ